MNSIVEQVLSLHRDGLPEEQIAAITGRSPWLIITILKHCAEGEKKSKNQTGWTDYEAGLAWRLTYNGGLSQRTVAALLGRTWHSVRRKLEQMKKAQIAKATDRVSVEISDNGTIVIS